MIALPTKLGIVLRVAGSRRGMTPGFTTYHVIKALDLLSRRRLGRPTLGKELGLGDASTRTLLNRLREAGLVRSHRPLGTELTELGREILKAVRSRLEIVGSVSASDICGECIAAAIIVREGIKYLSRLGVLRMRDLVVKSGADGALILKYVGGRVMMPTTEGDAEFSGRLLEDVLSKTLLKEGDVIIVSLCGGSSEDSCLSYAVNAVMNLICSGDCGGARNSTIYWG